MSIIRADSIKNRAGNGAPDFPNGITVTGVVTSTTLSRTSGNPGKIYTKFQEVVVGTAPGTVELVVADGEEFIVDAYQLAVNTKDVQ